MARPQRFAVRNPALTREPRADGTCAVCESALDGRSVCTTCGAAYGEENRCPVCSNIAGTEPDDELRHRCVVCGGPRIPLDAAGVGRSGREHQLLARAQRLRLGRAAWGVAAGLVGGFALLALAVTAVVLVATSPGIAGFVGAGVATAVPVVLAGLAYHRARKLGTELRERLDEAWTLVASDVARAKGSELTAGELARAMQTTEDVAERLLVNLSAADIVRARVTDHGDVVFGSVDSRRVRVGEEEGDSAEPERPTEDRPATARRKA